MIVKLFNKLLFYKGHAGYEIRKLVMIISDLASPSRTIISLKNLQQIIIIKNLRKKDVKERNAALEKTKRKESLLNQMQLKKKGGKTS